MFQPHFTALLADDSVPNDTLKAYFVERALGGVGLIIDGHMTVMVEGMMAPHYIRAWEEDFVRSVPCDHGRGCTRRAPGSSGR